MFKDKILLFFDALLDLFEGNNKIIYEKVVSYRHLIQNIISKQELLKFLTDFLIVPSNYEILKQQNIQKSINCDLNMSNINIESSDTKGINDTSENLSISIFKQLAILLNSCNIENQKRIWKWINNIIETVSIQSGSYTLNIDESYSED
jgi:hypothetical protein